MDRKDIERILEEDGTLNISIVDIENVFADIGMNPTDEDVAKVLDDNWIYDYAEAMEERCMELIYERVRELFL